MCGKTRGVDICVARTGVIHIFGKDRGVDIYGKDRGVDIYVWQGQRGRYIYVTWTEGHLRCPDVSFLSSLLGQLLASDLILSPFVCFLPKFEVVLERVDHWLPVMTEIEKRWCHVM